MATRLVYYRRQAARLVACTAILVTACSVQRGAARREAPVDEGTRFASLDSASVAGRAMIWRAHACIQRRREGHPGAPYPASDAALRAESACSGLPLGGVRSSDGWKLTYRSIGDTVGYELRASGAHGGRRIALYSQVLASELDARSALVHAREGDSAATASDPVVGSPLPMLVWIGWCLSQHETPRETGVQGYLLHILPLGGDLKCLGTPPFRFSADSDEVVVAANGMEYLVRYQVGPLEGESLSEPTEDGGWRVVRQWVYNTSYSMTATPVRYGETGLRSYHIDESGGTARPWITPSRPSELRHELEAPMCEWMRGTRCAPPKPHPNDGTFGPGIHSILYPRDYPSH